MGPTSAFVSRENPQCEPSDDEEEPLDNSNLLVEEVLGDRVPNSQEEEQPRFYVPLEVGGGQVQGNQIVIQIVMGRLVWSCLKSKQRHRRTASGACCSCRR